MAPRHSLLTETPVRPRGRCSIDGSYPNAATRADVSMFMSLVIAAKPGRPGALRYADRSGTDEDFERFPVGHGPVAVRHLLEADGAVEHAAGLERAVEHVGQELLDVGAGRRDAPGEGDVAHEHVEVHRDLRVLRGSDPADHATVAHDGEGGLDGRLQTDALQHGVRAVATGELMHLLDAILAAL